jgi:aminoglycoside 3-N-acetyltransferase
LSSDFPPPDLLDRFLDLDGKILLLGSDHDAVTFLHYVEHVARFPNKRIRRFQVPIMQSGRRIWRSMEEFDTSGDGAHSNWPDRFFAKIVDAHIAATGNRGGRIGNALSYILRAGALVDFARPLMEAVAIDPRATHNLNKRDAHS